MLPCVKAKVSSLKLGSRKGTIRLSSPKRCIRIVPRSVCEARVSLKSSAEDAGGKERGSGCVASGSGGVGQKRDCCRSYIAAIDPTETWGLRRILELRDGDQLFAVSHAE